MPKKYKVGTVAELDEGSRLIAEVNGQEIAVFNIDGEYHAVLNYCVHQAGPLCEGKITGEMFVDENGWDWGYHENDQHITCPWHGWLFDIKSGVNIHNDKYTVPTFNVEIEDDDLIIVR